MLTYPGLTTLLNLCKRLYWRKGNMKLALTIHWSKLISTIVLNSVQWPFVDISNKMWACSGSSHLWPVYKASGQCSTIQPCTHLTPAAPLVAIIDSCQVVLNGTPIHDPSTLVGATNWGLLLQEEVEVNTRMRNWSGTLLRGTVELVEAKSSICNATAYQPVLPVAEYWSVH